MNHSSSRRRTLSVAAAGLAGAAFGRTASAQAPASGLPTGTIRMLVPYPAGGGSDVMARIIAERLKERTGLNIVVENKAGASGLLAGEALKNSPPDGSVIMYAPSAGTAMQKVTRKTMPYDLEKDLVNIALAGVQPTAYVVSPTTGARSFAEYVEWLKKNPKRASFGTTAMGSNTHFFGVLIGQAIGIPLEPVAYKGAAPIIADLAAGHAPAGCGGLTDFLTHHRAGKLNIIAVSAPKRSAAAPDLPTIGELGYPKLSIEGWYGFFGPGRMSPALVNAWNRELVAALEMPDMKKKLLEVGIEVTTSTPAAFAERQARDIVAWTDYMKATGYQPE